MMEAALLAAVLHALCPRIIPSLPPFSALSDAADQEAARQRPAAATQQQYPPPPQQLGYDCRGLMQLFVLVFIV